MTCGIRYGMTCVIRYGMTCVIRYGMTCGIQYGWFLLRYVTLGIPNFQYFHDLIFTNGLAKCYVLLN